MHLEMILRYIPVEPGMKILDLGTGSGYLAFPFAEKYKQAEIIGLDIVEKTLVDNQRKAEIENINNLRFVSYDGVNFPFDDNSFDIVISRYALFYNGLFLTNEQLNDKKFLKMLEKTSSLS